MKAETPPPSRYDLSYSRGYTIKAFNLIQVVVIIVIWIISLLVIYMLFLVCLDPLLNKKTTLPYQEHNNEEVCFIDCDVRFFSNEYFSVVVFFQEEGNVHAQPLRSSGTGVLNRVGHQQDKWKRQVQEQRRHIYDRHTILN